MKAMLDDAQGERFIIFRIYSDTSINASVK